jgi:hypothetical protein
MNAASLEDLIVAEGTFGSRQVQRYATSERNERSGKIQKASKKYPSIPFRKTNEP